MRVAYRLCSSRFTANSGEGASLYGGRWNRAGTAVVYAAESAALAALEVLVHFSVLPLDFVLTEIAIPDDVIIAVVEEESLPPGWDAELSIRETQEIGDRWVQGGVSAVLEVPSSIVPGGANVLLNPAHAAFAAIEFRRAVPFRFDPRLK